MTSFKPPTLISLMRGTRLLVAIALGAASGAIPLHAQVSSDPCTAAAANRYPVNGSCIPLNFNKPATYVANYNPGGCNAGFQDDAFGSFIATSTLTTVQYTPTTNGADPILHVLQTCTSPVLPGWCADGAGNNGTETVTVPTVIGTTYYVRVQRYNSNGAMNGKLCIFNPTCLYTLTLRDSYGDGWADIFGQAYVEIIVGGVSLGLWSMNNGFTGTVSFGVTDGQTVQVIYYDGGSLYYDENSMELSVGGQCIYSTYAPPNIGLAYSVTANCAPGASALPQDCVGGATLCTNQNITSNSTTTGCTMDLNAGNRGCLQGNERQGTWYYFSPSTSGTLGFSLVPNGNIDYDFALWGPYGGAQCPNNAPVRCSWANGLNTPTYNTGMGNGATDNSEGQFGDGWVRTLNVTAGQVYVLYIDNFSATGQDFTLTWNLTGGASLDCTVLPVELLSLEATARDPVIDVDWATATEQNSDYFEVQRSPDNEAFTAIGTVPAAGDAQYRNEYRFTDTAPFQGANYYRLKQVDRDGHFTHTQTVVAFLGNGARNGNRPVIFPNPATDVLNVAFSSPMDGPAVLFVQDALGRIITESTVVVLRGEHTATVPTSALAAGWYNLRIGLPDGTLLPGAGFLRK